MISIYHDSPTSEVTVEPHHTERAISVQLGQWPRSVRLYLSADVAGRLHALLGSAILDLYVADGPCTAREEVSSDA